MQQSTRLIANTLASYCRMVLTVGLGLVTTRIVYSQLGETDFGLQSVVGAGGSLLLIFSDALVGSAQRHLAFQLGRQDEDRLRVVFNSSLMVFGLTGLLMALVGLLGGPSLLRSLSIPADRMHPAAIALTLTVGVLALTCVTTPFRAAFTAHQSIIVATVLDLLASLLFLGGALLLMLLPGDRLIVHSVLVSAATIFLMGVTVAACIRSYPVLWPSLSHASRAEAAQMIGFASWGFFGSACWRLFMQGATIALNVFFGPVANAGYAVAMQVSGYQMSLAAPVPKATESAIVTLEAKHDRDAVRKLTLLCSKYQSLITLFFLVPFVFEAGPVLSLWLKTPPHHAVELVRWVLLAGWATTLTTGHQQSTLAHGTGLAKYTLLLSVTNLVALGVAVAMFMTGRVGPAALPATTAILTVLTAPLRAWFAGTLIDLSLLSWAREVVLPNLVVGVAAAAIAAIPHYTMPPNLARIVVVTVAFAVPAAALIWCGFLGTEERAHFLRSARNGVERLRKASGGRRIQEPVS